MKTIQYTIGVVMVVLLAACDDYVDDDKAVISSIDKGYVYVNQGDNVYNLQWGAPRIYTNHGNAVVSMFEVCVARATGDDNMWGETERDYKSVMTTNQLVASVSPEMVYDALGSLGESQEFVFAVRLLGMEKSQGLLCVSDPWHLNMDLSAKVLIGATANPSKGYVNISGEGEMGMRKLGDVIELTAVPYENYVFTRWSDGETDNPRKIIAENDIYLEALFDEINPLYRVYVYALDEYKNSFDARQLLSINKNYVPLDDDDIVYQVAGAYEYGQTAIITVSDGDEYKFKQWSDGSTENPRKFDVYDEYVYLTAIFKKDKYELKNAYSGNNIWFLSGNNAPTGQVKDFSNFTINVGGIVGEDENGNAAVWDDNFEVVFHELENQEVGKDFQLKFSIKWEGETETAGFRICSGADKYILDDVDKDWDAWDVNQNTELIFDNFDNRMGQTFFVDSGDETPVEWGGVIGEKGAKYIGIEINLAGYIDDSNEKHHNGDGTFTISNMQVFMGGKKVWPKSE